MEDGQTLFDYNVGLNDIVQLLIRSQTDHPDSPATKDSSGVASSSAPLPGSKSDSCNSPAPATPAAMETLALTNSENSSVSNSTVNESKPDTSATSTVASTKNGFKSSSPAPDTQPPTSSRNTLINPGIGLYKVRMGWKCNKNERFFFEYSVSNKSICTNVNLKLVGRLHLNLTSQCWKICNFNIQYKDADCVS